MIANISDLSSRRLIHEARESNIFTGELIIRCIWDNNNSLLR